MDQNCCRSPSTFLVCRWCTKDVGGAAAGDGCLAADADALGVEEPLGGRPRRPDEEPFFPPPPPFLPPPLLPLVSRSCAMLLLLILHDQVRTTARSGAA